MSRVGGRAVAPRGGRRDDLGGRYFRSAWEANYARYLDLLVRQGQIAGWEYEPREFEFPRKRGIRFYRPDFRVRLSGGRHEWHEVKGWMDAPSRTKLNLMASHYPDERIVVIDRAQYRAIARWSGIIPGWEGNE